MIDDKEKFYSPIFNWYNFNKVFPNHPKQMILKFECVLCNVVKNDKLGKPGNLKKHLKIHDLLKF
jgi:hypothetical protein